MDKILFENKNNREMETIIEENNENVDVSLYIKSKLKESNVKLNKRLERTRKYQESNKNLF